MLSQLLLAKMKPELRKALETELDRLSARVEAIKILLETSDGGSTGPPLKTETVPEAKQADGRSLRWKNATPEQRKAWADAIKAGRKRRRRRGK